MGRSWDILLGLLRLALWGDERVRACLPAQGAVWADVRRLGREQALSGLLFDGLNTLPREERPPLELWLRWLGDTRRIETRNRQLNTTLKALQEQLVPLLPSEPLLLKGQGAARHYPNPLHRVAGDIDWLVGTEGWNALLAHEAACGLHFAAEREKHLEFDYAGVPVECHHTAALFYDRSRRRAWQRIESAWMGEKPSVVRLENGLEVQVPPPGFDALFLFVHAFMHLVPEGVGLRQLVDWVLLLNACAADIDGERLRREAGELGLTRALGAFGYVAVCALGLPRERFPMPVDDYREAGEWLLRDIGEGGNFGQNREQIGEDLRDTWRGEWRLFMAMLRRSRTLGRYFGPVAFVYPFRRAVNYLQKKCSKCLAVFAG